MKDKIKDKKSIGIIGVIALVLVSIVYYQFFMRDMAYRVMYDMGDVSSKYKYTIENIKEGSEVEQVFISRDNNLAKIDIHFNKVASNINQLDVGGKALIGLKDEKQNIIKEEIISYNYIHGDSNYKFKIPVQKESKDKQYYLYIRFLGLEDGCTTFFSVDCSNEDVYKDGTMYVDGNQMDGDLYFQEFYYKSEITILLYILTAIMLIIAGMFINNIYKYKVITEEKVFLHTIPVILMLAIFIMPTLKNHDEVFHWFRIYDMAQGHILTEMIDGQPQAIIPIEVDKISISDNVINLGYTDLKEQFSYNITPESIKIRVTMHTTAIYNPIQYLPQTLRYLDC